MGSGTNGTGNGTSPRASLKQRAADARAQAAASKRWSAHITAAADGTLWRVTASWIEQKDGAFCAELTHVNTGKVRSFRLMGMETIESCRARITATAQ